MSHYTKSDRHIGHSCLQAASKVTLFKNKCFSYLASSLQPFCSLTVTYAFSNQTVSMGKKKVSLASDECRYILQDKTLVLNGHPSALSGHFHVSGNVVLIRYKILCISKLGLGHNMHEFGFFICFNITKGVWGSGNQNKLTSCLCVSVQKVPDSVRLPERFV